MVTILVLIGFIWCPAFTALIVLGYAVFSSSRIGWAFACSKLSISRDFSLVAFGEVLGIVLTSVFAIAAVFGVIEQISEEWQMRIRIVMGYGAAWTTHRFYVRHHR